MGLRHLPGPANRMILTLAEMKVALGPGQRLLGLDPGTKTIGVAVSDPMRRLASPVETLRRQKFRADSERLKQIASDRKIGGWIIGLPVNMDGSEGPRAQSVRQFARNLEAALEPEPLIAFQDERLSTAAVNRMMIDEADLSRARRAKSVDAMAAAYILQGALDALANLTGES